MNTSLASNCTDAEIDDLLVMIAQKRYDDEMTRTEMASIVLALPKPLQERVAQRIKDTVFDANDNVKASFSGKVQ